VSSLKRLLPDGRRAVATPVAGFKAGRGIPLSSSLILQTLGAQAPSVTRNSVPAKPVQSLGSPASWNRCLAKFKVIAPWSHQSPPSPLHIAGRYRKRMPPSTAPVITTPSIAIGHNTYRSSIRVNGLVRDEPFLQVYPPASPKRFQALRPVFASKASKKLNQDVHVDHIRDTVLVVITSIALLSACYAEP